MNFSKVFAQLVLITQKNLNQDDATPCKWQNSSNKGRLIDKVTYKEIINDCIGAK